VPDAAKTGFMQRQYEFAAHIRDPEHKQAPVDIEDRRMGIYRQLFYNNVEGFLSSSFPVLRKLMEDASWHAMARDFYASHQCHSPLFLEIPREFLNYLQHERIDQADDLPFLRELAHYEWVELALSVAESDDGENRLRDAASSGSEGDLIDAIPVISALAWPLSYHYPVHRISPQFIPETPGEQTTYLLVYRDTDDEVGFIELNPVSARLLALLRENTKLSGRQALEQIAAEIQHPNPDVVIDGGRAVLQEWRQRGIVLRSND
jgi:hypothetical protein